MNADRVHFTIESSRFGEFALAWISKEKPKVVRIFIPRSEVDAETRVLTFFPQASQKANPKIDELRENMLHYLEGRDVSLKLDLLLLDECYEFQRRVIVAEYHIPRGWVSTYGRIARHIGSPGSSRAVGRALATHPFPIVIPCHRAVRSDGSLGGYQGGPEMKRMLLEMEGVSFEPSGKLTMDKVFY